MCAARFQGTADAGLDGGRSSGEDGAGRPDAATGAAPATDSSVATAPPPPTTTAVAAAGTPDETRSRRSTKVRANALFKQWLVSPKQATRQAVQESLAEAAGGEYRGAGESRAEGRTGGGVVEGVVLENG